MPASWLSLPSLDTAAPPPSRPDGSGRSVTLVSVLALFHGARRAHSQGLLTIPKHLSVVSIRTSNQSKLLLGQIYRRYPPVLYL